VEFDYIIIGGGSAGSTLAARLSEDPKVTVCLLEAGGNGKNFTTRIPALVSGALQSKRTNWHFETVPQRGLMVVGDISLAVKPLADHRQSMV